MGKDEHNKSKGRNRLAQTPKNQKSDARDIEFSEELADYDDKVAQERRKAADRRAKSNSRK